MSLKECTDFANNNQVSYLATIDGIQPRVRGMMLWFANPDGFYYHTSNTKNLYQQLVKNPHVELCFYRNDEQAGMKMLRVAGIAEFIENDQLKNQLLEERPFIRAMSPDPTVPNLVIFRISHGEAYFWTMADNMKEGTVPRIKF
jgi:pyridoxamine 5'-phosphate oxidase